MTAAHEQLGSEPASRALACSGDECSELGSDTYCRERLLPWDLPVVQVVVEVMKVCNSKEERGDQHGRVPAETLQAHEG